ncbi:ribonuclease HII [Clostridium polyendosporum]|uniref:Ribonuclease HII n=1 Tax=Clostridium polyendosporum TaxID=69208 RepID=A0A919RWM9_9CLOT|nr:ribonuclease HII [Clostridium polyendosporum]GIM27822.1 ribonuclease HII [Clostridium polyendosporum]
MEYLIEDLRKNISEYNFKKVNELLSDIKIDLENESVIKEIAKILSTDERKNIKALSRKIENKFSKLKDEFSRVNLMYGFDKSFGDFNYIAGVDEVGRGPLAGPIVAAAVILDLHSLDDIILGIKDSKALNNERREELSKIIKQKAIAYNIAECSNKEIDEKGIAYCNNRIFLDACYGLSVKPEIVLSDGYPVRNIKILNKAVVKGDAKSASIACASIIAKVYRDNIMNDYHSTYPQYEFKQNVGYGTKNHIEAIQQYGPSEIHRMSFLNNILCR